MTQPWQPPDQRPPDQRPPIAPRERQEVAEEPDLPPYMPPTPALGIISLIMGLIGAAATLVPVLRLPGILVGLVAATLAVVTVAVNGLGGKMLAAAGLTAGLASLPIAVALHLQSVQEQREAQQAQAILLDPSAPASPAPGTSTVVFEVTGADGADTTTGMYADVTFKVAGTQTERRAIRLPFTYEFAIADPVPRLDLFATTYTTGPYDERATLTCRIKVNGVQVGEQVAHGKYAFCLTGR